MCCQQGYSSLVCRGRATEEQKCEGWEMTVRLETIVAAVLDEAYKRQTMETLAEKPEGLYKRPPY